MRRCFYSFHYKLDAQRASQVRNIGLVEGNRPAPDNDWERIARGGEPAIKQWIKKQMWGRSCTVVLVGTNTAGRKWINYEIVESWNDGMGVVGIRVHGLKNLAGYISKRGDNPFDRVTYGPTKKPLSSIVKCYGPGGQNSKERYNWISLNLENAIAEAIRIRKANR